jgi:hypothetical protein
MYDELKGGPGSAKSVQWNQGAKRKNGAKKREFSPAADEMDDVALWRDRISEG